MRYSHRTTRSGLLATRKVKIMRLLIATTNLGKVREYRALLTGLDLELVGLNEVGIDVDVAETGDTYAANAALKACTYAQLSGLLTLADDSGLEVEALGGRPGVYSARYAPDSPARIRKLLGEMIDVPDDKRAARFQCVIVLATPDGSIATTEGSCEGVIAHEARGSNGFGFDPVFYMPERAATMAELPDNVKNQISHRARAAQKMRARLEAIART
jgi:XTP/dITP diphosphohydrolase